MTINCVLVPAKKLLLSIVLSSLFWLMPACVDSPNSLPLTLTPAFTSTSLPTATQTPTPTAASTETPTLIPTPTPIGGSGKLIFDLVQCGSPTDCDFLGVSLIDLQTMKQESLLGQGYQLEDVSPDGGRVLVSLESNLYIMTIDGSETILLSERFFQSWEISAHWFTADDRVVFIWNEIGQSGVAIINSDGSGMLAITEPDVRVLTLFPTSDESGVFWEAGYTNSAGRYPQGTRWSSLDGSEQNMYYYDSPAISPSGDYVAYLDSGGVEGPGSLFISRLDGSEMIMIRESSFDFATGAYSYVSDHEWFPDGSKLLVEVLTNEGSSYYIYSISGSLLHELQEPFGYIISVAFSPDGRQFASKVWVDGTFMPYIFDLDTLEFTLLDFSLSEDIRIGKILWIPAGG